MEEKIIFSNSKGYTLSGILESPAGAGPFPGVIICPGFTGWMNETRFLKLSNALARVGCAVLRFDFTGNGESEGKLSEGNLKQEISDLKRAIDFLTQRAPINKEKIGVIGHNLGASVALLTASDESRIKVVACLSPLILFETFSKVNFAQYQDELSRKKYFMYNKIHYDGIVRVHKITKSFIDSLQGINLATEIKKLSQPILFLYGTNDETNQTPEMIEELFSAANEPKFIEFIEGADHNFTDRKHELELIGKTVQFFKQTLI